jgi:signal transduction histidine kinase
LVIGLAVLTLLVSIGAGIAVQDSERSYLTSLVTSENQHKLQLLLFASIDDIISEDQPRIETTMSKVVRNDPTLVSLLITNERGHTIYEWHRGISVATPLEFRQDVVFDGEHFGTFAAGWDVSDLEHKIHRHALIVAASVGLICFLLSSFIFVLLQRMTVLPINRIVERLDDFRRGAFGRITVLPAATPTELRRLDQTVNQFGELLAVQEQRESEREAARQAAIEASRSKSEFLANMSHELRTPLNGVLGFAEIMRMKLFGPLGSPKYAEYADDIHQCASHLLDLINDLLDIARIEQRKLELDEHEIDLERVIRSSIAMVLERAHANGQHILEKKPEPLPMVMADERKLKQVLLNLLSNAIKFTPAGGLITLSVATDPVHGLIFEITDTGIGIPPDQMTKALEPFGQVDSTLARRYEGSGLGLPLAKGLIELHGGVFQLESKVGIGTAVRFSLPPHRILATPAETSAALVLPFAGSGPAGRLTNGVGEVVVLRR